MALRLIVRYVPIEIRRRAAPVMKSVTALLDPFAIHRRLRIVGLDEFDIGDFSTELADAKQLLGLGIQSDTFKKQVFKKIAFQYFCDVRQEIKSQTAAEIDASFEK